MSANGYSRLGGGKSDVFDARDGTGPKDDRCVRRSGNEQTQQEKNAAG